MATITDSGRPQQGAWATLRRGLALSPEFRAGLPVTLLLAFGATVGRVLVPIAVQQTIDDGLMGPDGADLGRVRVAVLLAGLATILTAFAAYRLNVRLFRSTEGGLATLRVRAFRHVHDLSVLTQNAERRGSLVSRVTSDVDTISTFMQWGGLLMIVSFGQLVVATILMAIYSWQLTLLVWVCFLPLFLLLRTLPAAGLGGVRRWSASGSVTCSARCPSRSSAPRPCGPTRIEERTGQRIDDAIERHRSAATRAQGLVALTFSTGELAAGLANAAVVIVGVKLGIAGELTLGQLLAFLFLVTLFVGPVQIGTEVLNEAQNAIAGWRRVLGVLDTPADVADPGPAGKTLPRGPIDVRFEHVSFAYPGGPTVLDDVDVVLSPRSRVAVVGETGSGKTTFAKLLTRLMDPAEGRVLVDGVDLRELSLRVAAVADRDGAAGRLPLRGLASLDNVRFGRPAADRRRRRARVHRARPARLARRAAARARHRRRPARGAALRGRAPARRAGPGLPRRPRPARARRGDLRGRSGDRGADRPGARGTDPRPHRADDRAPAVDRRGGRRGAGVRRRPGGRARPARRPGRRSAASTRGCTRPGRPSSAADARVPARWCG